jgi:hypothetical protein
MSRELFRLVGVWSGCWVVRDAPHNGDMSLTNPVTQPGIDPGTV